MRASRVVVVAAAVAAVACEGAGDGGFTLTSVPTPAPYVSGGQTLVMLEAPLGLDLSGVSVTVGGAPAARVEPAPPDRLGRERNAVLALVEQLAVGDNEVVAALNGEQVASITVTNWPIEGPIFSGEHLEPYLCLADLAPSANGRPSVFPIGNGEVLDGRDFGPSCSMQTRVDHVYLSDDEGSEWKPLSSLAALPDDAAETTTADGRLVPFVVRLETGTINRAIYQTAVLVDPAQAVVDPWHPPAPWNGRLVYTYGGGCEAGFFQGTSTGGVLREDLLGAGYAVASSTLNVNAQGGCNDPLSAETTLMVKERFAETYGPPVHTIGNGGSGGAMQQLLIAGAYPGILDGILPTLTFPDAVSYMIDSSDCGLLLRPFMNARGYDDETKRVFGGWATWQTCEESLGPRPNRIGPEDCPSAIPQNVRYHATDNPTGIRCSIYDAMRSVFGTQRYTDLSPAPQMDFGRNPHDNVGVQYGLLALEEGRISKDVFLDVNEGVGARNIDSAPIPGRMEADPDVVRIAYETGRITTGKGGLGVTPIIEERSYLDPTGNFHTSYYSFVTRERLRRDNGHADNYVLQRHGQGMSLGMENLSMMDRWLSNLALDASVDPLAAKVVRAKPAELVESCYDADGEQIVEPQTFDRARVFDNTEGTCNSLYPPHTGTRMIAGAPLESDVLKCQLKPLDRADYTVTFTDAEWARLQRIFPAGVCDWTKPGVGQDVTPRTWLSYGPSPVNRYTPPA
ncbi:MAG: DUF6351 family protein [Gemmatimonadales bacterium]